MPASTSSFNFQPSFSGGPNSNVRYENLNKHDRSGHRTNMDSSNSATESNKKQGLPDPDVPIEKGKKIGSKVKTFPDPSNPMDEDPLDETDEQILTVAENTVDPSGKGSYHFVFLIACS